MIQTLTYKVHLNALHSGCQQILSGAFCGEDRNRALCVTLYENSKPYPLFEHDVVRFHAKKPDGTVIIRDCEIRDGNATIVLPFQTFTSPGLVHAQIVVYGEEETVLCSPEFAIQVESPVIADTDVESTSEMLALHRTILKVNTAMGKLNELNLDTLKLLSEQNGQLVLGSKLASHPFVVDAFSDLPVVDAPEGLLAFVRNADETHPSGFYLKNAMWDFLPTGESGAPLGINHTVIHTIGTNPYIEIQEKGTILFLLPGAGGETEYPKLDGVKPPWHAGQVWVSDGRYWRLYFSDYWLDIACDGLHALDGKDLPSVSPEDTAKAVETVGLLAEAFGGEDLVGSGMAELLAQKHTHENGAFLDRLSISEDDMHICLDDGPLRTDKLYMVDYLDDEDAEYGQVVYLMDDGFYVSDGEHWLPILRPAASEITPVTPLVLGKTYANLFPRTDWEMVPVYELESRENFEIGMVLSDGSRIRLTESISREVPWPILDLNLSGVISNVSIVSWILNGEEYAAGDIETLPKKEKHRLSSAIRTLSQMVNESAEAMGDIDRIPDGVQRYCYPALSEYGRKFYLETAVDMAIDASNPGVSTYTSPFEPDKQNEIYLNALEDINLQIPASYAFYNGVVPDSSKGLHKLILGAFPGTNQLYIGECKLEAST